jgi:hypothetical protein
MVSQQFTFHHEGRHQWGLVVFSLDFFVEADSEGPGPTREDTR